MRPAPAGGQSARPVAVLLLVGLLVATTPVSVASAGSPELSPHPEEPPAANDHSTQDNATDTGLNPADHAYVERDGDVVLVIDRPGVNTTEAVDRDGGGGVSPPGLTVHDAGVDLLTEEGLAYGRVLANRSTAAAASNTTATLEATVDPDRVAATGRLDTVRPRRLTGLRVDLTGARTTERAGATLDAMGTVRLGGRTAVGRLVERAEANAYARVGPRNLTIRANSTATLPPFSDSLVDPFAYRAVLTEESDGFRLAVRRNATVAAANVGNWSTRAQARETLMRRVRSEGIAALSNATIRLQSYDFRNTSGGGRVDLSYTVRYEGVRPRLKPLVMARLATDPNASIGPFRSERLASDLLSVGVERAVVQAQYGDGQFEATTEFRLRGYNESLGAALDIADAYNETRNGRLEPLLGGHRERLAAAREAGLVREYRFGTTYERTSGSDARVTVDGTYRTRNWAAYVASLRERDLRLLNVTLAVHSRIEGRRLRANGSVAAARPGVLDGTLRGIANVSRVAPTPSPIPALLRPGDSGPSWGGEPARLSRALARSDVRNARVVIDLGARALRLEGGARVGTPGALAPLVPNGTTGRAPTDLRVSELVLRRRASDEGTLYAYAEDAVPENATASEVRRLAAVTDGTRVHLPGTWDRTFPRADRERAYEFLGVTPSSGSSETTPAGATTPTATTTAIQEDRGSTTGSGPGIGLVGALLAVAVALLARRRAAG